MIPRGAEKPYSGGGVTWVLGHVRQDVVLVAVELMQGGGTRATAVLAYLVACARRSGGPDGVVWPTLPPCPTVAEILTSGIAVLDAMDDAGADVAHMVAVGAAYLVDFGTREAAAETTAGFSAAPRGGAATSPQS